MNDMYALFCDMWCNACECKRNVPYCNVMQSNVMPCNVRSWHAMQSSATACAVVQGSLRYSNALHCKVLHCNVLSYSCHMSCHVSCHKSCHMPCHMSCNVISCCLVSCHVVLCCECCLMQSTPLWSCVLSWGGLLCDGMEPFVKILKMLQCSKSVSVLHSPARFPQSVDWDIWSRFWSWSFLRVSFL